MSEAAVDPAFLPGSVRLLVVDDDVAICHALAAGLASAGYQVVTANDIANATAQAEVTPPDIAIVDLGIPDGGGTLVIRDLKARAGAAVHVIVLTGHDDEHSRTAAFDAGTDDYVVKPVAITELRRRIAAAVRARRELVQVRLEKEAAERRIVYGQEAAALLAHDLNNGLTVALSNLSYLLDVVQGDADQREALEATLRTVRRMAGLVANFVDIARFEDAAVKPLVQTTAVRRLLSSVVDITHRQNVVIDCDPELSGRFDPGLIERVLHNLFGNAMRYCPSGGTITLGAARWHATQPESVELRVTNQGPPVPEALIPNLFGKYMRGSGGKRGMGLYFCRLVAEAHGGRIDYEVRDGCPSFVVRIPGRA